jgi:hypothetical protein
MHDAKARNYLETLILKAETILKERAEYYTDGAKLALIDMVKISQEALDGKNIFPFTRTRQFYMPREDEAIYFCIKRYTMVPTYIEEGVYSEYGLEKAIEWFLTQDVMYNGKSSLNNQAEFVLSQAQKALQENPIGGNIGCVPKKSADNLLWAMENIKINNINNSDMLAKAIVNCKNAIKNLRYSKILRTDIEKDCYLYFSKKEFESIKEKIDKEKYLTQKYEEIKAIADENTIEDIEKLDMFLEETLNYEKINQHFYIWSCSDSTINFSAPDKAKYAKLHFILPSCENEKDGLGHVWIDNIKIKAANSDDLEITNPGFEQIEVFQENELPLGWIIKGNSKIEKKYPFCGKEKQSIFLQNLNSNEEAGIAHKNLISLKGGEIYTVNFEAKIDGKLKKGIKLLIEFYDDDKNYINYFESYFNRTSSKGGGRHGLNMQCDAICYAFTNDKTYALKAKKQLLFVVNDFCQGIETWLIENKRPDGIDAYGAVQGGRILCSIATTLSFIKNANVFSDEEKMHLYSQFEYFLRYLLDLRDRTELSDFDAQKNCSNWQTDMCAGVGMLMMVLDDFPNRKTWLYNATKVLKAQLLININPDGSWPESLRYQNAALRRFALYAKALKNITGEDWFSSTPLKNLFEYLIYVQTPPYIYFNNKISTPPFGDHVLSDGQDFSLFGLYLSDIEKINKNLADKMYYTWKLAGFPSTSYHPESVAIENLFANADNYMPQENYIFDLESGKSFIYGGTHIFRDNFLSSKQSFFAAMCSGKKIGHGHLDQGSFILYKDSIPIILDSGIEGYFEGSTMWHISSYSHAVVQFQSKKTDFIKADTRQINLSAGTYSLERGFSDVPDSSELLKYSNSQEIKELFIKIQNPEREGFHIRKFFYIPKADICIIYDKIFDFKGKIIFNLPVVSKNSIIKSKNKIYSTGFYGIDLETEFLSEISEIYIEKGKSAPMFPAINGMYKMDYIRAVSNAENGFLTILHPINSSSEKMKINIKNENYFIECSSYIINIKKTCDDIIVSMDK